MQSRLPRFKRASTVTSLHLTDRDRTIIRLVHRHRFLRSSHITALVDGSPQQLLRRLQLLFHHGYLERPRAQLEYFERGGSRHLAYGLGSKGATLLKRESGPAVRNLRWGEKNRSVRRIFLEHALLVSDVMVKIELSCRTRGIRFITEKELMLPDKKKSFRWRVNVTSRLKLSVIPDRVFALEFPNAGATPERAHFFLEADRGTMPVKRRKLFQSSFFRKLLAYQASWSQDLHQSQFGFHRFRVLTVTTSAARVESLGDACQDLDSGHGLFLFADRSILSSDPFSFPWQTGTPGKTGKLLD